MQKYTIVSAVSLQKLQDDVNEYLEADWRVHGPVFILPSGYAQAIIRDLTQAEVDVIQSKNSNF